MEQDLNQTTRGNRLHISFFGMRNSGKSSICNAVTGQNISIVSETRGTTTDPVEKAMELKPLGPVVIVDTPGYDDPGPLGEKRVERARRALDHTDLAVVVVDATVGLQKEDAAFLKQLKDSRVPHLSAWNKTDLRDAKPCPKNAVSVSAKTGTGVDTLKDAIIQLGRGQLQKHPERRLFEHWLKPGDMVILVTPIDDSAPKGRMILPQVQTMREILDDYATCVVTQPAQLTEVLGELRTPPKLVVTDSQAFGVVDKIVPKEIMLTSFSILFARLKGVLSPAMATIGRLSTLPENSRILIAEGCTHHRQCEDIGTVKIPRWIGEYTRRRFRYAFTSGNTFPADLSDYDFVVHCGGCMLNAREMASRAARAQKQGVPFTNYGVLIAYVHGIYKRSLRFLEELEDGSRAVWTQNA